MKSAGRVTIFFVLCMMLCTTGLFAQGDEPTPNPSDTGVLKGRVMEHIGTQDIIPYPPIPKARIQVYKWSTASDYDPSGHILFRETYTDENGHYKVPDLPFGTYSVKAQAGNFYPKMVTVELNAPEKIQDFLLKRKAEPTPQPKIITVGHGDGYDYQTITGALDAAQAGVMILVADDEYSTKTGEVFPLEIKSSIILKRMDDTTLPVISGDANGVLSCKDFEDNARTVIDGFMITGGNLEKELGGGVYCENASPLFTHCIITGNSALAGAGVFCMGGGPTFYSCVISNNVSDGGFGGGVRCQDQAKARFVNCLFFGNSTWGRGGAAYCREGLTTFINCTVTDNSASNTGGVYVWLPGSKAHLVNCILWNNIGGSLAADQESTATAVFSCIEGGFEGMGNIDQDPLMDSADAYRLTSASPCIDAGHNKFAPPTDLDGNKRIIDGDGDGKPIVDMGCYEFNSVQPTPTPTPTPVQMGTLKGRVVEDVGMLTIVPPPIPGAHIKVFKHWSDSSVAPPEKTTPFRETFADEDGLYNIPELPYDYYCVTAEAEGYYKGMSYVKIFQPEVIKDFELKKKPLPTPTPTKTPEQFGSVYGRVLGIDENTSDTHPIKGAIIEIMDPYVDCGGKTKCIIPPIAVGYTDENGYYRIDRVPVRSGWFNWEIIARARGYLPESQSLEVGPGEEVEKNFTLHPGSVPHDGVIYGVVTEITNSDGIQISDLPPDPIYIQGAKVEVYDTMIYDIREDEISFAPGGPLVVVYTNERGKYRAENLPENRFYFVRVSARGYYPDHKTTVIYSGSVQLDFELKPLPEPTPTPTGGVIHGRVVEKREDSTEEVKPIGGAMVKIRKKHHSDNSSNHDEPPIIVYTNNRGYYKAEGMKPGGYAMEVRARGYYPRFRHVCLRPGEEKVVHFALRPVPPGPTPTPVPEHGTLYGKVFALRPGSSDRPTSPIAGAVVSIYTVLNDTSQWPDREPFAKTETDREGRYLFEDIPAGLYIAVAEALGYERGIHKAIIPPGEKVRLNFALRPDVSPTPTPAPETGAIAGKVKSIDASGNEVPIQGAQVLLFPNTRVMTEELPGPIRRTLTDEQGRFLMEDIEVGDYVLMARAVGYKPGTAHAVVKAGETFYVVIILKPEISPTPTPAPEKGDLQGHVAFERNGKMVPIPSARLMAIRLRNETEEMMGHRPVRHTATDEFGFYRFDDMFPGRYLVMANAQGFKPSQKQTRIKPSETTTLDFILERHDIPTTDTGTIFGTVMTIDWPTSEGVRPPHVPLEGADVVVLKAHQHLEDEESLIPAGRAVTDENGVYVVDNLPHGLYVVIARNQGYSWGLKKARVRHVNETKVNFLLLPLDMPRPDPESDTMYAGDFEGGDENWGNVELPDFFDPPEAFYDNGRLKLRCHNNINTFGYWHSPPDAVPVTPGAIYKAQFALSSDVTDPTQVPCIRIRFNSQSEQTADMVLLHSKSDGALSPGPDGRIYTHYFTIPSQEILLSEDENDIYVSFDMANIGGQDAGDATVSLDWVKIESIPEEMMPEGTEVATLDFSEGSYGWKNQFAPDFFTPPAPLSGSGFGALGLMAANNSDTFGTWVSPPSVFNMEGDTLYAITWDFFSDQADTSSVPGFRFRAGDEKNRLICQKNVYSNAEGDNSPDGMGRLYKLYYNAPVELDGCGMYLGYDIINFSQSDAPEGTIGLRTITIHAIPIDQMP